MAKIKLPGQDCQRGEWWDKPYCPGCGEEFHFLPAGLDSRCRGPAYSKEAAARGSIGPELLEFAKKHEQCPERIPKVSVSRSGITTRDYRWSSQQAEDNSVPTEGTDNL